MRLPRSPGRTAAAAIGAVGLGVGYELIAGDDRVKGQEPPGAQAGWITSSAAC